MVDIIGAFVDASEQGAPAPAPDVDTRRDQILEYLVVERGMSERLVEDLLDRIGPEAIDADPARVTKTIEVINSAVQARPELRDDLGPRTLKRLMIQAEAITALSGSAYLAAEVLARQMPDMAMAPGMMPGMAPDMVPAPSPKPSTAS